MALIRASLGSEPESEEARVMPEPNFTATHVTTIMHSLRCLEEGQGRLETQLRRIEGVCFRGPSTSGHGSIAKSYPVSRSTSAGAITRSECGAHPSLTTDSHPRPSSGHEAIAKSYPVSSTNAGAIPRSDYGAHLSLTDSHPRLCEDLQIQGQDVVLHALQEVTSPMEDELFQTEAQFVSRLRQQMLQEQEEARQALFDARSHVKGWFVDQPIVPIEHDREADEQARRAGGIRAWLNGQIVNGNFDMAFGLVILANAMMMLLRLEENGGHIGYKYGYSQSGILGHVNAEDPKLHLDDNFFFAVEVTFLMVFTIEIVLRVMIRYRTFFKHAWNYLDLVLVGVAYLDILSSAAQISYLRVLRLLRLTRALRAARLMRSFEPLRILLATTMRSMLSLLWAIVLISLILLLAACAMGMLVQSEIENESVEFEVREKVWQLFGTAGHSYYTFFRWTLTTSWTSDVELLIIGVNKYLGFFIFPFIIVVNFALIRVVSALFIRDTFAVSHKDTITVVEETMKGDNITIASLKEVFRCFDADMDGSVTKPEFDKAANDPQVQFCLKSLGVEPHELQGLFALLDQGMGQLSVEELIVGAMALGQDGIGKGVDLATVLYESQKTMLVIRSIEQQCSTMLKFMEYTMKHMNTVRELDDSTKTGVGAADELLFQERTLTTI